MYCNREFYNEKLKIKARIYKDDITNMYIALTDNFMKSRDTYNCIELAVKVLNNNGYKEITNLNKNIRGY